MKEDNQGVDTSKLNNAKRIIVPKIKAIKMFDPGPAKAMRNSPIRRCFKLYGLYGTGFAHPKVKPANEVIIGTMMEPTGSMCFSGFKVNLPCNRAVGSPRRSAISP